ncbi:MAG: response regulator [Nitrospirae bacterium]|nr:response regulator [Nitrospirota bacterium]
MKLPNLIKYGRENFRARIFTAFAAFILFAYFSFTAFFVYYQSKSLEQNLISSGRQLTNLLAFNSRLGVLAENPDLLKNPMEGILQNREVIMAQVFTLDGRELRTQKSSYMKAHEKSVERLLDMRSGAIDAIKKSGAVSYFKGSGFIEFRAPVISRTEYAEDEDLFLNTDSSRREVTGFVRIILTTEIMGKNIRDIFFKSILIPVFFMIPAWIITFYIVRRITKPLSRLTEEVNALGAGSAVEKVYAGANDEIGKLAEAFNDMAEALKKREAEKQQLEERLRHARKMEAIGTFAGGIAHDFNNILCAMIGYGELLQKKIRDEDFARHCIEQLLSSAEKGEALTKDILTYTKKQIIYPELVDLNTLIGNMEGMLRGLLPGDIEFKVETAEEDLNVMADTGQIERVLMNLAANARDAMPEGGILTIRTNKVKSSELRVKSLESQLQEKEESNICCLPEQPQSAADFCEVSVSDTGEGMDKDIMEKIFDPFFTTKRAGTGTGLGLSIVYGIVKQHEGFLDVTSAKGSGTTFKIFLPLSKLKISGLKREKKAEPWSVPKGNGETLLVAEDDEYVRNLLTVLLGQNGYRVIEASDGNEAVEKYNQYGDEIKLLLLDVIMPQKDGKTAYEEIKKEQPGVKAIFISGYTADIIHEKNGFVEGVKLLHKPVPSGELLRSVREILDN